MIKEIFLPEKIGSYRILTQRYIGLSVHHDLVRLAVVNAKHNKTVIEQVLAEKIEDGSADTFTDRAAQAIKKAIFRIKKYDQIRVCLPASLVIFKDLVLQFTDEAKIRMVLEYEIEAMLPFATKEAVVDFIITKVQKDPQQAHILVAAVRMQDLQNQLSMYAQAEIEPTSITIDLFALYGLYQQIPEYKNLPHAVALVEFGAYTTRIAFIQNGQLRLARYIQRGIVTILNLISQEAKISYDDLFKKIMASGLHNLNNDELTRIVQQHFVLLLNDIQFTLNSFSLKLNFYDGVSKILFTGFTQIPDFMKFCSDTMQIPCEIFDCSKLFENKRIKNKIERPIENLVDFAVALGTAIPSIEQSNFDLRRKQFAYRRHGLMVKQLATACGITLIMLIILGVKGYIDLHRLAQQAQQLEQREINRLKSENIFPKEQFPKKATLPIVVREAEKIVREKMEIWAPFSQQRMRVLTLWLELTRMVNKKAFDVTIKEVIFTTEEKGWEREKDGGIKKDLGVQKVEIEGLFKSKTGDHFVDFMGLENRFKESTMLKLIGPLTETTPAPDGGVNFVIKMKLKDV